MIVALIVSTVFLPFVVTVYAITGEIKRKETSFAAKLDISLFFPHSSGFVPDIQNVVQVSNGHL